MMPYPIRRYCLTLAIGCLLGATTLAEQPKNKLTDEEKQQGFVLLFNGENLDGWKVAEHPDSFKIVDGDLTTVGPRAHAFYMDKAFKNFELRSRVWFGESSNGGIYIHAKWKESGWPLDQGYEAQICGNDYKDPKKTGSIYNYNNVSKSPVGPGEWFDYTIIVKGRTVQTIINGKPVAKYTEPDDKRRLLGGHIALQCHDPKSKVKWNTIRIKALPDDAAE